MAFTGNEDQQITLAEAAQLTANYRAGIAPDGELGEFFSKAIIEKILHQQHCVGIRIYYGLAADGERHLVVSGVEANEDDLFMGVLAENALKSPPFKGINNPLN